MKLVIERPVVPVLVARLAALPVAMAVAVPVPDLPLGLALVHDAIFR
jgi:hypothetical protein